MPTQSPVPSNDGKLNDKNKPSLRAANMALIVLLVINLFNYIDRQILAAVVPAIRHEFFADGSPNGPWVSGLLNFLGHFLGSKPENALIGLLAMAFMLTYMLMAPIFGWLRVKRWWLIAGGVALWSLASGASGLAASFGMLLLTRCLVGIGEAAYAPIAPSMIADYFPLRERGTRMAWFCLAVPIGCALGYILGGLIAGSTLGWRWAFYLVVPPGMILSILCLFMQEPGKEGGHVEQNHKRAAFWRDYGFLLRIPSFLFNVLGMAAMTFAIGGMAFWFPSYIHESRHVPDLAQVNLIFGIVLLIAGVIATMLGGIVSDRLAARYPSGYFGFSSISVLLGVPCMVASLYVPFPWAWACIFMACFCLFFNTAPMQAILANVVPSSMRSTAFALSILITHALGDVISPMVVGAIADMSGSMNVAFLCMAGIVAIGGVLWAVGSKYLAADTNRATLSGSATAEELVDANRDDDPASKE